MKITRAHGTGGRSTQELVAQTFLPAFGNELLVPDDAVSVPLHGPDVIVTSDAHVVEPIIFPGGDIGKLAVTGVVNDLITRGGRPRYLSATFVLEEGLLIADLKTVVASMARALKENSIYLVCADTKVVPARGKPGLMISSTLFGESMNPTFVPRGPCAGDVLILTANIGAHGLALLGARENIPFKFSVQSDCASLLPLLEPIFFDPTGVHALRDVTRGGLAAVLHEWSVQHRVSFRIEETELPILPEVRAGLQLLGIDVLEVANEGVMLLSVESARAGQVLEVLRGHPLGQNARVIGGVSPIDDVPLTLVTALGGKRFVTWPEALNLPRIC